MPVPYVPVKLPTLTRSVCGVQPGAPRQRSRTKTCRTTSCRQEFVSPVVKDTKRRPRRWISPLSPSAATSPKPLLITSVVPSGRSRTYTCCVLIAVKVGSMFVAYDVKTT
jgi:hypothetical protein